MATAWPDTHLHLHLLQGFGMMDPEECHQAHSAGYRTIPDEKSSERCFAPASWTLWPWQDLRSQAAGWALGLWPCNFMLDLSSQRPPKFVHFHPHLFFQPLFAVKTSFRFFLASFFHFSSRVSQSFSQQHNHYLQTHSSIIYLYPQCGFASSILSVQKPIKSSNPSS